MCVTSRWEIRAGILGHLLLPSSWQLQHSRCWFLQHPGSWNEEDKMAVGNTSPIGPSQEQHVFKRTVNVPVGT